MVATARKETLALFPFDKEKLATALFFKRPISDGIILPLFSKYVNININIIFPYFSTKSVTIIKKTPFDYKPGNRLVICDLLFIKFK